mgnify:CR=1 FL=1
MGMGMDRLHSKEKRLARERQTIGVMIGMYCRGHQHATADGQTLCGQCGELMDYAMRRIDKCPFQDGKPACVKCPVHCYVPSMRERVRVVMRYAGPRMLYAHPYLALRHYVDQILYRKQPM